MARCILDVAAFEDAVAAGGASRALAGQARRSARNAVKIAAKAAWERTEAYRLNGRLLWLLGKQDQALQWWSRSISEGERLGARPELARTYMEVGTRLAEDRSKHRELAGVDAATYLEKSRALFAAMGLDWDLERATRNRRAA